MVLKLADTVPLVWRTPTSLQLGVDAPVVVVPDVTPGIERMLAALRAGVSPAGWEMLAREAGVSEAAAGALLQRLEPVLQAPRTTASARVLVTGDGVLAQSVAELLADLGLLARASEREPDLAVLIAGWVLGPDDAAPWLRRDVPHLPVVAADRAVSVGPFVEPGRGPCVYCMQLARADADAAWPAVAAQLWGRSGPVLSRLALASVSAFVVRAVRARLADGPSPQPRGWRLSDDGATISAWTARLHPRCSCAAPPESDWAPEAGRASPDATTTMPAGGARG
jgi:bacteriocin biosynthesis cyclodehydratase domain-containing protein